MNKSICVFSQNAYIKINICTYPSVEFKYINKGSKQMKKRILSMLLCFTMLVSMIPMSAFASIQDNSNIFSDINEDDWFYDSVMYAVENGIFSGVSDDEFLPNGPMTRGMYVTVMGRIAGIGKDYPMKEGLFSDVESNAYYAPYVMWAVDKGISQGTGDNKFSPDSLVTREQMATFTVRFFDAYEIEYPDSSSKDFPSDFNNIEGYAKDSVMKLWNSDLLKGDDKGNFSPKNNATRAEAATFSGRINNAVASQEKIEEVSEEISQEIESIKSKIRRYDIEYVSNGGSEIESQRLSRGSSLGDLPIPYKTSEIFSGWYYDKELENRVLNSDVLKSNIRLYAKYGDSVPLVEMETPSFASAVDQGTDFTIKVIALDTMTNSQVENAINLKNLSSIDQVNSIKVTGDGMTFEVSGLDGFEAGATYKLTLEDENLSFLGIDSSARFYNFTIAKEDVMNLSLNQDMIYIGFDQVENITQDGKSVQRLTTPLASISGEATSNISDLTEGTFTYKGDLVEGDNVTMYEGIRPDKRILDDTRDGADGEIAYLTITGKNGNIYSYKNAEVDDVIFKPDVLPVNNASDTDGNPLNHSITVGEDIMVYSDDIYGNMQLDSQTTIDIGDYIAFYEGEFSANADVIGYACISNISNENGVLTIEYTDASIDEIIAAMDMYNTDAVNGDALLEDVDIAALEADIEEQARNSGFADEAAMYLSDLALKTDSFTKLSEDFEMTDFTLLSEDGSPINPEELRLMAGKSKVEMEVDKLEAKISTDLEHFDVSGVRLTLEVGVKIKITVNDDSLIVINVTGTFEEEVHISINVDGGAVWKWWGIFPYIDEYEVSANIDLFNFTGIGINASIVTKEKVDNVWTDNKELQNITDDLKKLLNKKNELIGSGDDGASEVSVADGLTDKYKAMLETESDWVNLFEKEIFSKEIQIAPIYIIVVEIGVNFTVSANMNISIGCDFYYENAKRYTYTVQVYAKGVTSDVIDLLEEHYEFTFYVMGEMGLKAGIKAEIKVGLISTKIASVGFSAEAGVYVKVWGYFYYQLEYTASRGRSSGYAGALLFELGMYLEIQFEAQAFKGTFSYNPTLYENEWPLWTAGMQENVQDFEYEKTAEFTMKKHIRKLTVPDNVFNMTYMDLKTGDVEEKIFDDAEYFTIEIINDAFSYDPVSNLIEVTPDEEDFMEKGQMIISWGGAPLAFTSAPITRTFDLYWDNLNNGYTIIFNTNGGSNIPMILERYNAGITAPEEPTKTGYAFGGWYTDNTFDTVFDIPKTMSNVDTAAYAKWIPRQDTVYTVEHYQQNSNNNLYTLLIDETEKLSGETDSLVTPEAKSFAGFDIPEVQNIRVLSDGSSVLKYYYSRGSYNLTFDPGQAGGDPVSYKYKYGKTVTAPRLSTTGYTFKVWDIEVPATMPAENMTFIAQWSPAEDSEYRVEHYIQNTDGEGYALSQIEHKTGNTDQDLMVNEFVIIKDGISFEKATVDGKSIESTHIKGDGTLVMKLYYTRNEYKLNYIVENGDNSDEVYRYGEITVEPITPVKDGYTFTGWKTSEEYLQVFTFGKAMPAESIDVYGRLIPNEDTNFTVEHYYQNTADDDYSLSQMDSETGTTDENLDLSNFAMTVEGMTFKKSKVDGITTDSSSIRGDGSLVVKLYYSRNEYDINYFLENGKNIEETYLYGQDVILPDTPYRDGYTFSGWYKDIGLTSEYTVPDSMISEDIDVYGALRANSGIAYRVMHYMQNADDDGYTLKKIENLTGYTDERVVADEKSYEYFNFNEDIGETLIEGRIVADGSLVLSLYYDRKNYSLNYVVDGLNYGDEGIYKYEETVIYPDSPEKEGYNFDTWQLNEENFDGIMPGGNTTLSALWSAGEKSYTVRYYQERINYNDDSDCWELMTDDSSVETGTYDDTIRVVPEKEYTGFTTPDGKEVLLNSGLLPVDFHYTRNSYLLNWNLNGGTLDENDYTESGAVRFNALLTPPEFVITGKSYVWDKDIEDTMPAENLEYSAIWTAKEFEVNLNANMGVINSGDVEVYTYGIGAILPVDLVRLGYTFDGWYDGESKVSNIWDTDFGDKSYIAKWTADTYKITYYNLEEAKNHENNADSYTYEIGMTLGNPSKTGYEFLGWYRDEGLNVQTASISNSDVDSIDLYAKWKAKVYNVTLNKAGGTLSDGSDITSYTYDIVRELPTIDKISKEGYLFNGWFDGENIVSEIPLKSIGDKSYTADWSVVTYSISYELYGGDNSEDNPDEYNIESSDIYLASPSKSGYTFEGWYTDSGFVSEVVDPAIVKGSALDVNFYAKWKANTYTVTFNVNEGSGLMIDQSFKVDEKKGLNSNSFTHQGYDFVGWATSVNGGKSYDDEALVENLSLVNGTVINLYALWTPINYTISYNLDSGTNGENPTGYNVESQGITLNNPTKDGGYVFNGWYDNTGFTGEKVTEIEAGSTGNLELHALWKNYGVFNISSVSGNTFTITRSIGFDESQTVYYRTQNGSAIGGTHFEHVNNSVVFEQGDTSKIITITENSVSSAYNGNIETQYANSDREYFFDIYKVEGGGNLGSNVRASRMMPKDNNYTVSSTALNGYKQITSVNYDGWMIEEKPDGTNYKRTINPNFSSKVLENSAYSVNLQTYIRNTASKMKIKLTDFYGWDDSRVIYRFVLFNNHSNYVDFSNPKETTIPDLPSGSKCALVYGITDSDDEDKNFGVNLPSTVGSLSVIEPNNMSYDVSIHDIIWESEQDCGDYVLYDFGETCGITIGTYCSNIANNQWFFKSAKLLASPKDIEEPNLLDVAPMAGSFNDGEKVVVSLVFDEIVNSAAGVSIKTNMSKDDFTLKGGLGTNVLYFEGTVSGYNVNAPTKTDILINNSENIKDMCN